MSRTTRHMDLPIHVVQETATALAMPGIRRRIVFYRMPTHRCTSTAGQRIDFGPKLRMV